MVVTANYVHWYTAGRDSRNLITYLMNKEINSPSGSGIVRIKRLLSEEVPVSRSTLYQWINAGNFPAPIRLGPKAIGFRLKDIRAWQASREKA